MNEIKPALEEAVRQGLATYHWWIFALSVVGSGVGAFLSSYLKAKAEHKAATEHFEAIRLQLQTTTRDTEEIKLYLSSQAWRSQQQWSAREKHYRELLDQLHKFRTALGALDEYFIEPGSEHTPDSAFGERFHELRHVAAAAYQGVGESLGTAALYLSANALHTLGELRKEHWGLANFESACTAEYVSGAHELASQAYEQVLSEAKEHLGLAEHDA